MMLTSVFLCVCWSCLLPAGCGGAFSMEGVSMNTRYIFEGSPSCQCGYCASVQDGILLTPNENKDVYDTPDLDRKMSKDLPPSLISLFQHSYNWMVEKLQQMDLTDKGSHGDLYKRLVFDA